MSGNFTFKTDKDRYDVILGTQSSDTICSTGICVNQPEFSGIRIQWNRSLNWDVQQNWITFSDQSNQVLDIDVLDNFIDEGKSNPSKADIITIQVPTLNEVVTKDDRNVKSKS